MKRFERIGMDPKSIDLEYRKRALTQDLEVCGGTKMTAFGHASLPVTRGLLALEHYLLDDPQAAAEVGKLVVKDADDFFFGDWRSGETEAGKQNHEFWVAEATDWGDAFRMALCWGSALGQWGDLKKLAEYPSPKCPDADGKDWKQVYLALAAYLLGADASSVRKAAAAVTGKGSAMLLATALTHLIGRDADALSQAMAAYLKRFKKIDFPKSSMLEKQSLVGSFILHAARRDKVPLDVSSEGNLYLVDLSPLAARGSRQ